MNNVIKSIREVSLALVIIGAGLGMYLNFYLGNIGWNNYLMFFALLFIPNWNNLMTYRLYKCPQTIKLILCFQIYVLAYMVLGQAGSKDYVYIVFTIVFLFGLLSIKPNTINWAKVINYTWLLGWLCLVLCSITIVTGTFFIEYAKSHDGTGYESVLMDLTMAANLINFMVCCLYIVKVSKGFKVKLSLLGILISIMLILVLGKRTPLIVGFILICLFIFHYYPISRYIRQRTLLIGIGIIAICIFLFQIPVVNTIVGGVFNRTVTGILDMLYGSANSGMAAVARYTLRNWTLNYIDNQFNLFNYIFGAGYMIKWIDAPLLQSFLDMGLIGFLLYFYLVILKPIKIIFSSKAKIPLIFWVSSLCCYNILSSMNSGIPYSHIRWIPLILLFIVLRDSKNKTDEKVYNHSSKFLPNKISDRVSTSL